MWLIPNWGYLKFHVKQKNTALVQGGVFL